MRLIDADAAIESLTEYGNGRAVYIGVEEAVRRIEQLPSAQPERKAGRWIPCSERQPDKEGDYLVTLWDDGRTWVEIALWNETFSGRWQAVLYNDVDYSDISNVIAWLPLPEPYQGVER